MLVQYACLTMFYVTKNAHFEFQNIDILNTVMVHLIRTKKSGFYLVYLEYRAVWDTFNLR